MKIGILGAPGTGKSRFAKKLSSSMVKAGLDRPIIIDGYVERLEQKTGFAIDIQAAYTQNLQVLFNRWTLEQEATYKEKHTITCGTMYETFIYSVLHSNMLWQADKTNVEERIKAETTLSALAMIETMIFNYDAIFFKPYSGQMLLEKGKSYDTVVDQKIPEVLEGFDKECIVLDKSEKENVDYATEISLRIAEFETAENVEQAIRGSGEDSLQEPDSKQRMSDVLS